MNISGRANVVLVCVFVAGALLASWVAVSADDSTRNPSQDEIANEQVKIATDAIRVLKVRFEQGSLSETDTLFERWYRRLAEAKLALSRTKAERVAVIEELLKSRKHIEELMAESLKVGRVTSLEVGEARYQTLEAEQWLAREQAR